MFTDIVGYTAMMQVDERLALDKRARYTSAIETHHDAGGGTIVQRLGDGSLSMFPNAIDAVLSAIRIQQELTVQDVPVRIGIHLGEVIVESTGLVGDAVNIASRIESFSVPGSVMLSDTVHDQIKNQGEVNFAHLGRFRLKNVGRPYEIYAASSDGIVVPDPRTLEGKGGRFASLPSNLPDPVTPLLGRDDDLTALIGLVEQHRVVTITGPGGVGKTRTVVELGRRLAAEFLDGVAFISMAHIDDPADFVPALAEALDVKEAEGRSLSDGIAALIANKKALVLLDNLEQVASAAPDVARLAASCRELRIVTTSRTPLRIAAEREYPLAPLPLPPASDVSLKSLLSYPGIALFVERARAAKGSFELTAENAAAVASVCQALDGLPLALELAAARLRIVPFDALLDRLDKPLDVLTTGPRDTPERQQTLRATIDWSHSLLTETEQRLFRRMAVFSGGCTFADLEAVCSDPGGSILDDLAALVDNALVQTGGPTERFGMLQTIAEFARERLNATDEAAEIILRRARRYAELAGAIRDGIEGTDQIGSLERGIVEEGNLQAALDTFRALAQAGDVAAAESGMQLCGDLWQYWHMRGKNLTAREYATAFLDVAAGDLPTVGRVGALVAAGLASSMLGQFDRANDEWRDAYRTAAAVDTDRERCITAICLGFGQLFINVQAGLRWTGEGIQRSRAMGFAWAEGIASIIEGFLYANAGDVETAQARLSHATEIQRRLDDWHGMGLSLGGLAQLASASEDLSGALDLYGQSLAAFEAVGDRAEIARVLSELAWTRLRNEDTSLARQHFLDSVQAYTDVASVRGIGLSMVGLAACEAVEHRPVNAVTIAAAAEGYAGQEGIVNVYSDETPGREFVDRARAELSTADVARASAEGSALTIEQALNLARISEPSAAV
ncbi:MAG: adenylate/guanylate cyclase domain-containing protein [Actinomycetota bacterium]